VSTQLKPSKRRPPPSQKGGPGKRRQRFSQRDIERAQRAAPDRTIRILRDGTLELLPVGESAASNQQDDLEREHRQSERSTPKS
jgi:hypothetical protein